MRLLAFVAALLLLAAPDALASDRPSLDTRALAPPTTGQQVAFVLAAAGSNLALGAAIGALAYPALKDVRGPFGAHIGGLLAAWTAALAETVLSVPLSLSWGRAFGLPVTVSKAVIGASTGVVAALFEVAFVFSGAGFDSGGDALAIALYMVFPVLFVAAGAPLVTLAAVRADRGDEGVRQLEARRESVVEAWRLRDGLPRFVGVPLASASF